MKKINIFVITIFLFSFTQVKAQRGGVALFLNLSDVDSKALGNTIDTKIKAGWKLGPVLEFPLVGDHLDLETGVALSSKGYKMQINNTKYKTRLIYLETPLNLKYNIGRLFLSAGPYVAFGIAGKSKTKDNSGKTSKKVAWGSDPANNELKRFDYGVNLGFGIEYSDGLQFRMNYAYGLANITNMAVGMNKNKNYSYNRVITIGFIYMRDLSF